MRFRSKIAVVIFISLCAVSIAQNTAEPPDHGAYYRAKDGWQKLEILTTTGASVHAFSGVIVSYRGAESPVQLSDRRPVFYIKATPDKEAQLAVTARNTVIVLLDKKKDHRELQTVKSGLFGAKGRTGQEAFAGRDSAFNQHLLISITPNQDLVPGEFCLRTIQWGASGMTLESSRRDFQLACKPNQMCAPWGVIGFERKGIEYG